MIIQYNYVLRELFLKPADRYSTLIRCSDENLINLMTDKCFIKLNTRSYLTLLEE